MLLIVLIVVALVILSRMDFMPEKIQSAVEVVVIVAFVLLMVIAAPVFTLVMAVVLTATGVTIYKVGSKIDRKKRDIENGKVCTCGYRLYGTNRCSECGKIYQPPKKKVKFTKNLLLAKEFTIEEVRVFRRINPDCTVVAMKHRTDFGDWCYILKSTDNNYVSC